jgi:hypothetical protein
METLATALVAEGYPVQFVVLSDQNAIDFEDRTAVPLFRDASPGLAAWDETQPGSQKHDTFVYARDGVRSLFWDRSERDLDRWATEIRAAVEAEGR